VSARGLWDTIPSDLKACNQVGAGVRVEGDLYVENLGRLEIADRVRIRSVSAQSHLVTAPTGTLTIGRDVQIGHGVAIACHERITIGHGVVLGPYVMLMDTDFHEAGKHDEAGGTAPICIGNFARLGARVTVLRGSTIGEGAIVEPGSVVKGDIPPGAHVGGVPARSISQDGEIMLPEGVSLAAVCRVVAHSFGLAELPHAESAKAEIANWDSLGTLNLLLSLEQAFGVNIDAESMQRVETVGDLVGLLRPHDATVDVV
jgi:acetyltransferase-like isoleucine patch superfamily enzyme/acyl carrier protein